MIGLCLHTINIYITKFLHFLHFIHRRNKPAKLWSYFYKMNSNTIFNIRKHLVFVKS